MLKDMKMRPWSEVDKEREDKPRYPSLYFSGDAAKAVKPANAVVGGEYMLVAKVKISGIEEHDGEMDDSVNLDVLEAELTPASTSDADMASRLYKE